jgi:hypothetical protein
VFPFFLLLNAREDHFCSMDVRFGILQILHQYILSPGDDFVLVGMYVRKSSSFTYTAPKQSMVILFFCLHYVFILFVYFWRVGLTTQPRLVWNLIFSSIYELFLYSLFTQNLTLCFYVCVWFWG